jgi:hypothetical protein
VIGTILEASVLATAEKHLVVRIEEQQVHIAGE